MTDYTEVTVRVPVDLEVERSNDGLRLLSPSQGLSVRTDISDADWRSVLFKQIAAAIEARKPRPPKFQVGDAVEWRWSEDGALHVGAIREVTPYPGGYIYWFHGMGNKAVEESLTLVRRAAK